MTSCCQRGPIGLQCAGCPWEHWSSEVTPSHLDIMSRPLKTWTAGEQLDMLRRIFQQVETNTKLPRERVKRLKKHLSAAMIELQAEMVK